MLGSFARRSSIALLASVLALSVSVADGALTLPASATSAPAPSYAVNSTADATGSTLCATATAQCTLRGAIAKGNTTTGATITVPAGVYALSLGQLTISKPMTIVGARQQTGTGSTTIDGGAKDRVFRVASTGVQLDGLVIQNGKTKTSDGFVGDDGVAGDGGGILVSVGAGLTLLNSTLTGNVATHEGGAIDVDAPTSIRQTTITGNRAASTGGGITSDATLLVETTTITGNTGVDGGGLWANGTTTVRGSTITANTATSSNGGGLYRKAGTVTVTGSILAGNTASTGPDCFGTPTFAGTNIVKTTTGCSAAGGTILTVDPQLDALAYNGGPTQTLWPRTGSPAINAYNIPCATVVDQRNVARPQPTGGKCDLGAVEVSPLGLNLALSTNTDTIAAGAASVRIGDLPPAALIPGTENATQLGVIKRGVIKRGPLDAVDLAVIKRGVIKRGVIKRGQIDLSVIKRGVIKRGVIKRGGDIPLSAVTLFVPGGWDAIFNGTPLEGAPIETLTLNDAVPFLIAKGVTLDEIDLGPLESLPFASWLLSEVPLAHIPLTAALRTGTDQARLNAWCSALTTATQNPCADLAVDPNVSPASGLSLFDVSFSGYSIDTVTLDQIVVRDVVRDASEWFGAMPLSTFDVRSTTLGTIPVSALPAGYVDCTKVTCATATLGIAAAAGAISTTKTLFDLFTDPGATGITQLQRFTLADLYQGLIAPEDLPWDQLDLANVYLQNAATPKQPVLTYTMTITVTGDRFAAATVNFQLPPGFDNVRPGSLKIDGAPLPDPTFDSSNRATLALGRLSPGVHTATLATYAGLVLGPATASAKGTATAGSDSATAQDSKTVTVVEALENRTSDPASDFSANNTVNIQPDQPTLYLAQLSTAPDRDFYRFNIPANGQTTGASIVLGNLPADYDMVLFGPQSTLLRNTPQQRLLPVDDHGLDIGSAGQTLAPDTVQDVPLSPRPADTPGVIAVSANRGTADEEITLPSLAPGNYAIEIAGYNGATSPQPYSLRMTTTAADAPVCAAPPQRNSGDTGPLTGAVTSGPNPHVLFVVPQQRLFATYGHDRAQPIIDRLQALASSVGGTILPVDNAGSPVAQKYAAWDANRCSVAAANDVVREIGKTIDAARDANPNIDSVVLIGDDSVLPMARVPDRTSFGNESTYGSEVTNNAVGPNGITSQSNELAAALLNGYTLTDDAYGTRAGIAVNEHELFVPDVAVGRLVETPEDITAAVDKFLDPANNGTLDQSTANSALVTGFDFMVDGAQQVASNLHDNGKTVDSTLIGDSWTANDLRGKLFGANAPGIDSINTHFDQSFLLPAQSHDAQNHLDLFGAAELTDPAHPERAGALARRLLFTMGCHSGLSVSDVSLGSTTDWAQAITGAKQGGLFAGNTGYGLGDDATIALTERLMALYAKALDGSVTAGRAMMIAKQQYLATTAVLTPYDEKVLAQVVFYGLPIYKLGGAIPADNTSVQKLSSAVELMAAPVAGSVTIHGTDPRTGRDIAPLTLDPTPELVNTPHGSFYKDGQPITAQFRPIEPGTSVDVTQRDSGALTQRAHGVLITALNTQDAPNFTPRYFRPTVDSAANEPPPTTLGDAAFPSSLARVTTAIGTHGPEQQTLLTEGQARDFKPNGTVTQRLFTHIGGVVEYAPTNNTDFDAPFISTNEGEIVGNTAGFTVVTDDTARRVFVLYKTQGDNGAWKGIDLTPGPAMNGTITWWGGGPTNGTAVEFATQAVDEWGNVALSNNKVENFLGAQVPTSGSGLHIAASAAAPPVNGFFHGPVTVTITGPAGASIQYSLDGGDFQPYTGPIQVGGDGVHHVIGRDLPLGDITAVDASIDTTAPTVSAAVDPGSAASTTDGTGNTWYDGPVAVVVTGDDGITGSGVDSINYRATGAGALASTTINDGSSPPIDRSPTGTASTRVPVSADGTTTVTAHATDASTNQSVDVASTVKLDTAKPVVACGAPDGAWHHDDVTIGCTVTDSGVGLTDPSDASFTLTTSVAEGTQTNNASTNSRSVCDKLGHCATAGPVTGNKVDKAAPTITITTPAAGAQYAPGQNVPAAYACSDDPGGSGLAAPNGCTGTVINGAPIDTTPGGHSFTVTATDAVGRTATTTVTYTVPSTPLVVLGKNGTCVSGATGVSLSSSARVRVNGPAVINTKDANSTCTALRMTNSSSFQATSTKILQGGSCTAINSAVCPPTTSYSPAISDPFAGLTPPSATGLPARSGCPGGNALPGVYASTLSITDSSTCQLAAGIYILKNGLSVSSSARLTTAAGGVLLYIAGGSFSASTSATINIAAQTSGPYANLALWQAKTSTSAVAFSTSGITAIAGFIYAPGAAINMSSSSRSPTVTGIVAQNLILTSSANLVIGNP